MPPATQLVGHVAVVGAGIAGLAAAYELRRLDPRLRVTVVEATDRVGGKLATGTVAGLLVDTGAESFLARRPEALDLAVAAGVGDRVVHPRTSAAAVFTRGRLRPLPTRTVLGVPTEPGAARLRSVLSGAERARLHADRVPARRPLLAPGEDVAIGRLVERRVGTGVVERLVEPLLGGVYAGRSRELSLGMTAPALHRAAQTHRTLLGAARSTLPPASSTLPPVFGGLDGGVGSLPSAVVAAAGVEPRLGATVRALERTDTGWRLVCGSVPDPSVLDVDAVVLAVPAAPAARLLASHVPAGSAMAVTDLEYASVAVVTLTLPAAHLGRPLRGSGLLVPPAENRVVKAATYSAAKWAWVDHVAAERGLVLLRASIGRAGEAGVLQRPDVDLVDDVRDDLADLVGPLPPPVDALVTRWGGALPQYAPGHADRVDLLRRTISRLPGLAVCGAAYDGVGIPACIASGRAAAAACLDAAGGRMPT